MPEFVVISDDVNRRLDHFLTRELPAHSRAYLQQLILAGHILVGGRPMKSSYRLRAGDQITVTLPPPKPSTVTPEAIPLEVLYEDPHLLVVNKP
ncbi:MAG: S4 domain-containing protein, partial [Candidatus Entotheonellia bacterium]